MVVFPNAKVNLGLYITQKRFDGFHDIETIFLPVPKLSDILEILPLANQTEPLVFSQTGIAVDGELNDNLCVKAYYLLNKHVDLPNVAIHLHKQIPMGAGLGGGSADGAFTLKLLNDFAPNPLQQNSLFELALELGSDCPFFFINTPCFARGRGEVLENIDLNLKGYFIVLVNPRIHVHTGKAYSQSIPMEAPINLRILENIPIEKWRNMVTNDFEKVVFPQHSEIEIIKNELYNLGAVYSSMSGSGSTVFGIFRNPPDLAGKFEGMYSFVSEL